MRNSITKSSKTPLGFVDRIQQYQNIKEKIFHHKSDMMINGEKLAELQKSFFHFDSNSISQLIKNELGKEGISIAKITSKSTGHALYKILRNSEEYILRINILSSYFTDISFYLEKYCQDHIMGKISPSLSTIAINISRIEYPFDYMITTCAAGENLENHDDYDIRILYKKLGIKMAKVHSVNYSKFGHPNYRKLICNGVMEGTSNTWIDFFLVNFDQHLQKLKELDFFSESDKKLFTKVFEKNKSLLEEVKCSLLHNDLGGRNIIAKNNRITGIIDWEDAILGDPVWELAFIDTFMVGKASGKGYFESFCSGYGVNVIDLYNQTKFWIYYLRIAMLKAISRNLMGYYNAEGLQIDRWRIKNGRDNLQRLSA